MSEVKSYDDPNSMFTEEVRVLARKESKKPLLKWCQLNIKAGTRLYRNIGASVTCTKGTINIPKGIKIAEKSEAKVADESTMGVLVQNGRDYKRVGGVSPAEEILREVDGKKLSKPADGWFYWGIYINGEWRCIRDIHGDVPNDVHLKRRRVEESNEKTDITELA
jgi:hypothetical protein